MVIDLTTIGIGILILIIIIWCIHGFAKLMAYITIVILLLIFISICKVMDTFQTIKVKLST